MGNVNTQPNELMDYFNGLSKDAKRVHNVVMAVKMNLLPGYKILTKKGKTCWVKVGVRQKPHVRKGWVNTDSNPSDLFDRSGEGLGKFLGYEGKLGGKEIHISPFDVETVLEDPMSEMDAKHKTRKVLFWARVFEDQLKHLGEGKKDSEQFNRVRYRQERLREAMDKLIFKNHYTSEEKTMWDNIWDRTFFRNSAGIPTDVLKHYGRNGNSKKEKKFFRSPVPDNAHTQNTFHQLIAEDSLARAQMAEDEDRMNRPNEEQQTQRKYFAYYASNELVLPMDADDDYYNTKARYSGYHESEWYFQKLHQTTRINLYDRGIIIGRTSARHRSFDGTEASIKDLVTYKTNDEKTQKFRWVEEERQVWKKFGIPRTLQKYAKKQEKYCRIFDLDADFTIDDMEESSRASQRIEKSAVESSRVSANRHNQRIEKGSAAESSTSIEKHSEAKSVVETEQVESNDTGSTPQKAEPECRALRLSCGSNERYWYHMLVQAFMHGFRYGNYRFKTWYVVEPLMWETDGEAGIHVPRLGMKDTGTGGYHVLRGDAAYENIMMNYAGDKIEPDSVKWFLDSLENIPTYKELKETGKLNTKLLIWMLHQDTKLTNEHCRLIAEIEKRYPRQDKPKFRRDVPSEPLPERSESSAESTSESGVIHDGPP